MKKINIKKPSSFVLKTKSPKAYKNEERKSREVGKSLESYTNDWLEGRISDKDYKTLKNDLYKRQEKIINTNYMKTYSVLVTEDELKLFSEFLEQREFFDESFYHYGYEGSIDDLHEEWRDKLVDESRKRDCRE